MASLLPSLGRRKLPMLDMPKAGNAAGLRLVASMNIGDTSFVAPKAGFYTFYAIGAGGLAGTAGSADSFARSGGGSGAIAKRRVSLSAGQTIALVVGNTSPKTDTTVSFPDGLMRAGSGFPGIQDFGGTAAGANGGAATGGDVNINGNASAATSSITGAGASTPVLDGIGGAIGGPGRSGFTDPTPPPGPGAGAGGRRADGSNIYSPNYGGVGLILIFVEG